MSMVLFHIGWMKNYQDITDDDPIIGGGGFVVENERGGEIFNFLPIDGDCYGYVRQTSNTINMSRVGAEAIADCADDVTVIFTATRPEGGCVVIGWYKEARVWPKLQGDHHYYFAKASKNNCVLLKVEDRIFPASSRSKRLYGLSMGTSLVRYLDRNDAAMFKQRIATYMKNFSTQRNALGVSQLPDPVHRVKVERAAVDHVISYYKKCGHSWESVEADNRGWDLEVTEGETKLLVEVKGRSGEVGQVELTPNEYSAMTNPDYRESYRLAIVTHALDDQRRRLSIVSYSSADGTWCGQNAQPVCVQERTGARVGPKQPRAK